MRYRIAAARHNLGGIMRRFTYPRTHIVIAILSIIAVRVEAQAGSFGSGSAVGLTVQAIGTTDGFAEVPAVGLHMTSIRPSGFGVDVTIATVPSVLILLAPDVGIARVFPIGGGGLMLKGGPSGVIVASGMGGAAVLGAHVGAVAFLRLGSRFGIRAEVVPRFYAVDGRTTQLTTYGIGFTSLPTGRR